MGALDLAKVAAANDAWVLAPEGSEVVETAEYRLMRFPERFADPLQVQWVRSSRPAEDVLSAPVGMPGGQAPDLIGRTLAGLDAERDLGRTMQQITSAAKALLAVDGAGLVLADERGQLRWATAFDQQTQTIEEGQERLGEGACVNAFAEHAPLSIANGRAPAGGRGPIGPWSSCRSSRPSRGRRHRRRGTSRTDGDTQARRPRDLASLR